MSAFAPFSLILATCMVCSCFGLEVSPACKSTAFCPSSGRIGKYTVKSLVKKLHSQRQRLVTLMRLGRGVVFTNADTTASVCTAMPVAFSFLENVSVDHALRAVRMLAPCCSAQESARNESQFCWS